MAEKYFYELRERLDQLQKWRDLAIRPRYSHPSDADLMAKEEDDICELSRRCLMVRQEMNAQLPRLVDPRDSDLYADLSTIPNAGLGLFFRPLIGQEPLPANETICYYYGHIHDYHSAKSLKDRSYLMSVQADQLVDPGPLPHVKARYINDPLNEKKVNCRYVPAEFKSAVVTTRMVYPGEELFVSYGDAYWSVSPVIGRFLK